MIYFIKICCTFRANDTKLFDISFRNRWRQLRLLIKVTVLTSKAKVSNVWKIPANVWKIPAKALICLKLRGQWALLVIQPFQPTSSHQIFTWVSFWSTTMFFFMFPTPASLNLFVSFFRCYAILVLVLSQCWRLCVSWLQLLTLQHTHTYTFTSWTNDKRRELIIGARIIQSFNVHKTWKKLQTKMLYNILFLSSLDRLVFCFELLRS